MSYENCADTSCPAHFRNDTTHTASNTLSMIRYVGEYAVLVDVATQLGEILAMIGSTVISHCVDVYRVGHGSLSDIVDPETRDALPGTKVYTNTTVDAASALELAEELIVMINAGTFNGDNL